MLFNIFNKNKDKEDPKDKKINKYHWLKVKDIIRETPDAITIIFDKPTDEMTYEPGQFLTLILPVEGKEVRRSYSLCTSPFTDPYPAVTVKRVASGKVSNYLNDTLRPGDTIRVMEPMGVFTTPMNAQNQRHVVMFGGGSGITPLMSLIKSLLHSEPHSKVSLIYANRHEQSIIFKDQLEALQQQYTGRLHIMHVLEEASEALACMGGLITPERIPELLSQLPYQEAVTDYFLCGPQGMMDNVMEALRKLNIPPHQIHKESFVASESTRSIKAAAPTEPTTEAEWDASSLPGAYHTSHEQVAETHEVTILYDGETYRFAVDPESSILQTALALDIDLPYSCQSGMCTACMGKCTSGRVKLDDEDSLTEDDLKEGYVLTCVGHPLTSDVVIKID